MNLRLSAMIMKMPRKEFKNTKYK